MRFEPSIRLQSCLAAATCYLTLASLVLFARLSLFDLGFPMDLRELHAARSALLLHTIGGMLTAAAWVLAGVARTTPVMLSKLTLAVLPLLLIASLDRFAVVSYPPTPEQTIVVDHPTRGWTYRPHWTEQDGGRVVHLNSKGLRNPEISKRKSPDEQRIVFLGDSVTAALRVEEREGFVRRVERLASGDPRARRVTTISCAVTGYAPWQELDLLHEECMAYQPDVVLQVFCLNDVVERYQLARYGGDTRGLKPATPTVLEWSGIYRWVHSSFAMHYLQGQSERERIYSVERVIYDSNDPIIRQAWDTTLGELAAIHDYCAGKGIPFAIVCFPYAEQASPFVSADAVPQTILATFAAARDIPFLDLLPVFRMHCAQPEVLKRTGNGWEGLDVLPDRIHPTPDGHLMAANEIYRFLIETGLIE